jgi:hypothetical protein
VVEPITVSIRTEDNEVGVLARNAASDTRHCHAIESTHLNQSCYNLAESVIASVHLARSRTSLGVGKDNIDEVDGAILREVGDPQDFDGYPESLAEEILDSFVTPLHFVEDSFFRRGKIQNWFPCDVVSARIRVVGWGWAEVKGLHLRIHFLIAETSAEGNKFFRP